MTQAGLSRQADVIVIGAGIMGLTAALHMARSGMRVTVLDRKRAMAEASGVNAGSLGVQNKLTPLLPYTLEALDLWRGMSAELGTDVGFRNAGGWRVAINTWGAAWPQPAVTLICCIARPFTNKRPGSTSNGMTTMLSASKRLSWAMMSLPRRIRCRTATPIRSCTPRRSGMRFWKQESSFSNTPRCLGLGKNLVISLTGTSEQCIRRIQRPRC